MLIVYFLRVSCLFVILLHFTFRTYFFVFFCVIRMHMFTTQNKKIVREVISSGQPNVSTTFAVTKTYQLSSLIFFFFFLFFFDIFQYHRKDRDGEREKKRKVFNTKKDAFFFCAGLQTLSAVGPKLFASFFFFFSLLSFLFMSPSELLTYNSSTLVGELSCC